MRPARTASAWQNRNALPDPVATGKIIRVQALFARANQKPNTAALGERDAAQMSGRAPE